MFGWAMDRRKLVTVAALALLAGCKVVPKAPPPQVRPPERPVVDNLPTDRERHRVALLVPMSGPNGPAGQSIANAANMALLDTNAQNLRITTYDTTAGAANAVARAVMDGNKLILGPLTSGDIPTVVAAARAARLPVISYSNDEAAAQRDVFVMGHMPGQAVERVVRYAGTRGANRFGALVPAGEYGQRASAALFALARTGGASVAATETYDRGNTSVASAARRLKVKGGYDAVLIADGGRIAAQAGPLLKAAGAATPRLLGTELWSGEAALSQTPALRGAWYAAVTDARFRQFAQSYQTRFGAQPYRIATLGYDSVLLTLRIAREWRPGTAFPTGRLGDRGGFLGLDGAFRFKPSGVVERALEVREVRAGGVTVVSPAPARFDD